ncbi:hypothetical protein [Tenacibaculum sp. SDUM215027]|uniref:hypothetical protein n=1 Tax=Tenacibaculum sp. SDUM215027 TaxID=3422596 RepID=UPI003D31BE67
MSLNEKYMNNNDVIFDEDLEFYTSIEVSNNEICVTLSDALEASEEELTESYKSQIATFINSSSIWYEKAATAIINWAKKELNIEVNQNNIKLMNIFVLYEQNEQELYGLQFRVDFDIEHGCGLKIKGDDFEITEIGDGDVAFC